MPDRIGVDMLTTKGPVFNGAFSPWVGMMILCIYAVALLVIGNSFLQRRDA
jgi:hypothetical protein